MVSATIEKAFFISFGLVMCSVLCVPIYGNMNEIIIGERISSNFHRYGDAVEAGMRIVEHDQERVYNTTERPPEGMLLTVKNGGWTLVLSFNDSRLALKRSINANTHPITLVGSYVPGSLSTSIYIKDHFMHVAFIKQ